VDAIVGLDGRRVLAVVPLVDGTELIFDGDYNGNLVTVDSDGSFHIGSAMRSPSTIRSTPESGIG
jgi:hypothetical protein